MDPRVLFTALTIAVLSGCSGGAGDLYKGDRGEVFGKITFEGKPIPAGSTVIFQTKEGANYTANGTVNAAGEYTLRYNGSANLPAVTYVATVFPPAKSDGAVTQMSPDQMSSAGAMAKPKEAALPFPAKYSLALSSGLEFPVKKGKNTANFELTP